MLLLVATCLVQVSVALGATSRHLRSGSGQPEQQPVASKQRAESHQEAPLSLSKQEVLNLQDQVESLQIDKAQLVQTVEALLHTNRTAPLEREIARLNADRTQLTTNIAQEMRAVKQESKDLQIEKVKNAALQNQSRAFENKATSLQSQVTDLQRHLAKVQEENVDAMQQERARLRQDEISSQQRGEKERAQLTSRLDRVMAQLEEAKAANTELRERGIELLKETETMRPKLETLNHTAMFMAEEKHEAMATLQGLIRENTALKEKVRDYQSALTKQVKEAADREVADRKQLEQYRSALEMEKKLRRAQASESTSARHVVESTTDETEIFEVAKTQESKSSGANSEVQPGRRQSSLSRNGTPAESEDQLEMMGELAKMDTYIAKSKMQLKQHLA